MADIPFMRLNGRWRLAYDNRQWIIQRLAGCEKDGAEKWEGRKFIGCTRATLIREIARLKIKPTMEAAEELASLPASFGAFLREQRVNRPEDDMRSARHKRNRRKDQVCVAPPKVPHSAISGKDDLDHPKPGDAPVRAVYGEAA